MAPQLFDSEAYDMAFEREIERSGTGIDFDAFLAACPDLFHTPEGEKIVQAYMDDCIQSN